jgi:CelD/BcsL family acetyltransferase involved in cellulose biosynthesis
LRVEVLEDASAFAPLRDAWNDLVRRSAQNVPFLTHEWLSAWWDAFGGEARPQVVTVRRGAELVGAAPTAYRQVAVRGVTYRQAKLWANPLSNRAHLLAVEPAAEVVGAIVDHWLAQCPPWDMIALEPVPLGCSLTRTLYGELERRGVPYGVRESLRSPYVPLPDTWEEFLERLRPSFRKALRREVGAVRATRRMRVRVAAAPEAVEDVFEIARAGRFHAAGTSIASSDAQLRFYREVARAAHRRGWLLLALLEHDGRPVAYEYDLCYGGVVYSLKAGYRPEFAAYSPGRVLMHDVLRRAVAAGVAEYDLLGMDEQYKLRWTNHVRHHGRITIFSRRFLPLAQHFFRYRMRPWIKSNLPWAVRARRLARAWLSGPLAARPPA